MRKILFFLSLFILIGCSSKVPTLENTKTIKSENVKIGSIASINYERKSSLIEDFGSFVVGDAIGSQFGGGVGKDVLGIVGGTITSDIYENKFADEYTKLNIVVDKKSYPVYIKGHIKMDIGSKVKVSIKDDKISAISLGD